MKFNFDQLIDRHNTYSTKWDKYKKNIIPLWIADSDFCSPPCIIDALKKRINHGIFGYSNTPNKLIENIIMNIKKRYEWDIKPEWIILLPGVVTGLNICVRAFTKKQERTIAPIPIYPPFKYASKYFQKDQINAPLIINKKRWVMDLKNDNFLSKINGKEKLFMLCNPQNPGGTVYRKNELKEHLNFAKKNDLIVCSDEIHSDLILEKNIQHIPFASLEEDALQRTITLISPSKTFNIAGLGISFAIIANKELRILFNKASQGIVPKVNILAMIAANAAIKDGNEWLFQQIKYLRKNRDLLSSNINKIEKIFIFPPEGTYLGWINVSQLKKNDIIKWFEKYGVGLSCGSDFGDKNFVRINFACPRKLLEKAITRIHLAINELE